MSDSGRRCQIPVQKCQIPAEKSDSGKKSLKTEAKAEANAKRVLKLRLTLNEANAKRVLKQALKPGLNLRKRSFS